MARAVLALSLLLLLLAAASAFDYRRSNERRTVLIGGESGPIVVDSQELFAYDVTFRASWEGGSLISATPRMTRATIVNCTFLCDDKADHGIHLKGNGDGIDRWFNFVGNRISLCREVGLYAAFDSPASDPYGEALFVDNHAYGSGHSYHVDGRAGDGDGEI